MNGLNFQHTTPNFQPLTRRSSWSRCMRSRETGLSMNYADKGTPLTPTLPMNPP